MTLKISLVVATLLASTQMVFAIGRFPVKPDANLTPGSLCQHADEYRYPEHIPYCERDVTTFTKMRIIQTYDARFGYGISHQNRADFKIDHYIPLCMGGSNDIQNLWPQHKSVFNVTDPLEQLLCEKMKNGKLKQAQAVDLIRQAKNDLSLVNEIIRYADRLR